MNTFTDHGPTKYGHQAKDGVTAAEGPTSQIPGLSHGGPEERSRGRRVGVHETDSDYVKLAKQGGQKGLLWHEENNLETKPNTYKAPDWFSASSDSQDSPSPTKRGEALASEEQKSPVGAQPRAAPYGSDNKSTWEREAGLKKCGETPVGQMEKLSLNEGNNEVTSKFKKTAHDKGANPVNMSKLLSFGYAEDEKKSPSDQMPKLECGEEQQ